MTDDTLRCYHGYRIVGGVSPVQVQTMDNRCGAGE